MVSSDDSDSIFVSLSDDNNDTRPGNEQRRRVSSLAPQNQLPIQSPPRIAAFDKQANMSQKEPDDGLNESFQRILSVKNDGRDASVNHGDHTDSSEFFLGYNRSTVTNDSNTAALSGIAGKKKKHSIIRQRRNFLKKKSGLSKAMIGDAPRERVDPLIEIGTDELFREAKATSKRFSSNPSALRSARSDESSKSESTGSYDTVGSSSYSQSTTRRDDGFFGGIVAASAMAFGTVADSIDLLFDEAYPEDSEGEETADMGSIYSIPKPRIRGEEKTFGNSSDVAAVPTPAWKAPSANNHVKGLKSSLKKKDECPLGKHDFERIQRSQDSVPGSPPIKRNLSEEEIAADIMVYAVESLFKANDNCASTKVTFACQDPIKNNAITTEAATPTKIAKTASTDSTPQPEIPFREPKQKGPVSKAEMPDTKSSADMQGAEKSQATVAAPPSPPRGSRVKAHAQPDSPKTEAPKAFAKEDAEKELPDNVSPRCIETKTPEKEDSPLSQNKLSSSHHESLEMSKSRDAQPEDQTVSRSKNQTLRSRSIFARGRRMRRTFGSVWRAQRQGVKEGKQTKGDATDNEKPPLDSPTSDPAIPLDKVNHTLAVSVFPESASHPSPDRENVNAKTNGITGKGFDMNSICGQEAKKKESLIFMSAISGGTEVSSSPEKKKTSEANAVSLGLAPQSSATGSSEPVRHKPESMKPPKPPPSSLPNSSKRLSISNVYQESSPTRRKRRSPSPNTSKKSDQQPRGRSPSPDANPSTYSEPKRQGFLSALRRKGKSLLNMEGKPVDHTDRDETGGIKTTIIMTNNPSSLNPISVGRSTDLSDDDSSTILEEIESRETRSLSPTVGEENGFLCSSVAAELANQCPDRCSYRLQNPEAQQQQLCYPGYFPQLEGNTAADPFMFGIRGQIDSFVAGLTGSVPEKSVLEQTPSTDETGHFMICRDSDTGKEAAVCGEDGTAHIHGRQPQDTKEVVDKQEIKSFIESYQNGTQFQIGQALSLEYFEGAFGRTSEDWTSLAERVVQTEPRLPYSEAALRKTDDSGQPPSFDGTSGAEPALSPSSDKSGGRPALSVAVTAQQTRKKRTSTTVPVASKTKQKEVPSEQPPRPLYSVSEAPLPVSPESPFQSHEEEKHENTDWVEFGVVFEQPRISRRFPRDKGEEKVTTPDPNRRRKAKVGDLAFPVDIPVRQFAC